MTSYPGSIASLGTKTGADFVSEADINGPSRELEQIALALGTNPKTIDDTVIPSASPANVGQFLNMAAYSVKNMAGVEHWYDAAVPPRLMIGVNGGGYNVAPLGVAYIGPAGAGAGASALKIAGMVMPFAGVLVPSSFYIQTLSAGDGDAFLVVYMMKNESIVPFAFTLPSITSAAGIYRKTIIIAGETLANRTFAANDILTFEVVNEATTGSGYNIGALGVEFDVIG